MDTLSRTWWLFVPLAVIALQIPMEIFLPQDVLQLLHSEQGPHEFVEFVLLVIAFLIAAATLTRLKWPAQKWLVAWFGLAAVCCFYVAGEEVSWGQKFVQWSTPEFWAHFNDQNETNLHNTSSWFDQKPRIILLIGVIAGGLVIPFLRKFRPQWVTEKFAIIYPPAILGVTAFITLAVEVVDKIDEHLDGIIIFERASEVVELYLFYFVLMYLVVLRRRVLQN